MVEHLKISCASKSLTVPGLIYKQDLGSESNSEAFKVRMDVVKVGTNIKFAICQTSCSQCSKIMSGI